jgi:hypothetical protein
MRSYDRSICAMALALAFAYLQGALSVGATRQRVVLEIG